MSPAAGSLLLQAQHIIVACLARGAVKSTGAEDVRELAADGTLQAAKMIDAAEQRGKTVPAGSVAHYVLQGMKTGRRHGYAGRSDVMSPGAQLDGRSAVVSMDAPVAVGRDQDGDEDGGSMHDLLASTGDDTDTSAARNLDWAEVLPKLDDRRQMVLRETAAGYGPNEIAEHMDITPPRVVQLRQSCGSRIMDAWGDNGIADVVTPPRWCSGLRASAERRACRYEQANR